MDISEKFPLTIPSDFDGQRLDVFLAAEFPDVSRSRWSRLIHTGAFSLGGMEVLSSARLKTGQILDFDGVPDTGTAFNGDYSGAKFAGPEPSIIFEDENFLVVNKPDGLTVHPGHGVSFNETLVAWLLTTKKIAAADSAEFLTWGSDLLETGRPGIVHRLDKGTSGAIAIAKNPRAHQLLAEQFQTREAGRLYTAVVEGRIERLKKRRPEKLESLVRMNPAPAALRIQEDGQCSFASFLERDPADRTRFRVSRGEGKKAVTHFKEVAAQANWSRLELKLDTGRTHQIRIHLSFLGFPIVGDDGYGGIPFRRLWLHAHALKLRSPTTDELMEFHAPLPDLDAAWLIEQGLS